jgi:hypothetical protein
MGSSELGLLLFNHITSDNFSTDGHFATADVDTARTTTLLIFLLLFARALFFRLAL